MLQDAIPRLGDRDLYAVLLHLGDIRVGLATDFNKAVSDLGTDDDAKKEVDTLTEEWSLEDIWLHAGIEYIQKSSSKDGIDKVQKIFEILDQKIEKNVTYIQVSRDISNDEEGVSFSKFNSPYFTTLDNVLTRTIVSSLNNVKGVLNLDQLDDLVGELSELNDSRHHSWFHRGFVDNLLKRELREVKSGDNLSRRAWYVTGHLVASMRSMPESEYPALLQKLSTQDMELLRDKKNKAPSQLLLFLLKPLLEQDKIEEANIWIVAHGRKRLDSIVKIVLQWASSALLIKDSNTAKIRSVLDTTLICFEKNISDNILSSINKTISLFDKKIFNKSIRIQKRNIEFIGPDDLNRFYLNIRYLRAISFRMEGQLNIADKEFEQLIEYEELSARIQDLWVQRGLVKIGIRRLDELHIPADKKERETFTQGILSAKDWFNKAVEGDSPSPIALVLLSLPEVVFPQKNRQAAATARENLDRAIDIMRPSGVQLWESREGSLREETHLLSKARFYSTLLDLRTLDDTLHAQGQSLVMRLQDLFRDDKFPSDFEIEAVECVSYIDAPGVAKLATTLLDRHAHEALNGLSIVEISKKSEEFRAKMITMLENSQWLQKLTPHERYDAWLSLLRGCNQAYPRDIERAEYALDSLQRLSSESSKIFQKFVDLLEGEEWSPAWEERDRNDALFNCFVARGDISQAINILADLTHREISNRSWMYVDDLLELVEQYESESDILYTLRKRRRVEYVEEDDQMDNLQIIATDTDPISIIFVGGNEIQKRYKSTLNKELKAEDIYIQVSYHFTDWSSNWPNAVTRISNELLNADAMVLMPLMRTGLGRRLRPLADEHGKFWMPCTGHGRDSMKRSILEAARVVRQQRNKPPA